LEKLFFRLDKIWAFFYKKTLQFYMRSRTVFPSRTILLFFKFTKLEANYFRRAYEIVKIFSEKYYFSEKIHKFRRKRRK